LGYTSSPLGDPFCCILDQSIGDPGHPGDIRRSRKRCAPTGDIESVERSAPPCRGLLPSGHAASCFLPPIDRGCRSVFTPPVPADQKR